MLPDDDSNGDMGQACPNCGNPYRIDIFPAMYASRNRPAVVGKTEKIGDASCFFHSQNSAVVPCSSCGRFLCDLCDIRVGEAHLCPKCMDPGQGEGESGPKNGMYQYDNMALFLATVPALLFWPAILTAPMAIIMSIVFFRKPCSILPRTRIRFYAAFILALGEIVFLVFLVMTLVKT